MRWCLPIAVLLGLSITDAVSFAQGQGDAARLSPPRSSLGTPGAGYFKPAGMARFQLIQGRLNLDAPRHRKGSQSCTNGDVYESISVTACRGIPSLHYVFQCPCRQITLDVEHARTVRIESYLPKLDERAVLIQPANGQVTWTIQRGDLKDVHRGATLLHIQLADSRGFGQHCGELIRHLLRDRSLHQVVDQTHLQMLSLLHDPRQPVQCETIMKYVEKLASRKSSVRHRAAQSLLSLGTPIIPVINAIDTEQMDAEQNHQLGRVLNKLRRVEEDTPASLAMMLVNDTSYWNHIAGTMTPSDLTLLNARLDQSGLKPIAPIGSPKEPRIRIASGAQ